MSTEIKTRPVLRPAGNVARQDCRGANPRKPTNKKPPASPPLRPSPALSVKISPPNSLPTTPRASLPKSPALIKPGSSPKLAPTKPSGPSATIKPNTPLVRAPEHPLHCNASPCPSPSKIRASPGSLDIPNPTRLCLNPPASLGNSCAIDYAPTLGDHAPDFCKDILCATLSASDVKEPTPESSNDALNFTNVLCNSNNDGNSIVVNSSDSSCGATKTVSPAESPAPQKKVNRRSSLSRSTSDNFQRRHAKGNGSSSPTSIPIGCHSLDDTSLAQLVAAKKAAACESSVQRKLRVSEYGRKAGKAGRIAPDVPPVISMTAEPERCKFITPQSDPLYVAYHDHEWGVPVHDDRGLFELLVLAGAQVELSWTTILHKRELYRNVFCGYDPAVVASFKEKHIQLLEADKTLLLPGAKIRGVVENARRVEGVVKEFGSLDTYLWSFLNHKPMINDYRYPKQLPAKTSKSEFISKDLVRRGFRFVGPTIIYSFMQAAGMTNDHLVQCFRHKTCMRQTGSFQDDTDEIKFEVSPGYGHEVEDDSSVSHVDAMSGDSKLRLHELELQTHHLGQKFAHSDFVHIEAY